MKERPISTTITLVVLVLLGLSGAFIGGVVGLALIIGCMIGLYLIFKRR